MMRKERIRYVDKFDDRKELWTVEKGGAILTKVESTVGLPLIMMMMMSSRLTNIIINETLWHRLRGQQKDCTHFGTVCLLFTFSSLTFSSFIKTKWRSSLFIQRYTNIADIWWFIRILCIFNQWWRSDIVININNTDETRTLITCQQQLVHIVFYIIIVVVGEQTCALLPIKKTIKIY